MLDSFDKISIIFYFQKNVFKQEPFTKYVPIFLLACEKDDNMMHIHTH